LELYWNLWQQGVLFRMVPLNGLSVHQRSTNTGISNSVFKQLVNIQPQSINPCWKSAHKPEWMSRWSLPYYHTLQQLESKLGIYLEVGIFPARFLSKNSDQDLRWRSACIHTFDKLQWKHNKMYILNITYVWTGVLVKYPQMYWHSVNPWLSKIISLVSNPYNASGNMAPPTAYHAWFIYSAIKLIVISKHYLSKGFYTS